MKNITKILIIALVSLFALGIMMQAVDASHTFKKGGYKMKVTDKQYKKLKTKPSYTIVKKVGTQYKKAYSYKTVKTETYRTYYNNKGYYIGSNEFQHHNGYWGNRNAHLTGDVWKYKTHYNSDGSYYKDMICYKKWRFTKKVKKPVYMCVTNLYEFYGYNKISIMLGNDKYFCF